MKHLRIIFLLSSLSASVVSIFLGCSSLERSKQDNPAILIPFVENNQFNLHSMLAVTAERRMVFIKEILNNKNEKNLVFCSEAPPDSTTNLSESLSASLSASVNSPTANLTGTAAGEFAKGMASYANQLFYRTQGLQYLNVASFNLCLEMMNGYATDTFLKTYETMLNNTKELIAQEIPYLAAIKNASNPFRQMSSAHVKLPIQKPMSSNNNQNSVDKNKKKSA